MLASISPLGERARHNRWASTVVAYVAGSVIGGAAIGVVAGLAGWGLRAVAGPGPFAVAAVVAAACAAGAATDLVLAGERLPGWHRQVNEDWLVRYRGWVYGVGFGVQLGFGVVTIVTTAAVYLMVLLACLAASVPAAIGIGTAFGLARALPVLLVGRARDPDALHRILRRTVDAGRRANRAAAVLIALTGVAALVAVA